MIVGFKAMARGMLQTQKKEKLISMLVTAGMASYFNYRNKTRFKDTILTGNKNCHLISINELFSG